MARIAKSGKPSARTASADLLSRVMGNEQPRPETLGRLVRATLEFDALRPWTTLHDADVIVYDSPDQPRCYCTVMGAAGQSFGMQTFVGASGLAAMDLVQRSGAAAPDNMALFFEQNYSLVAEMVGREEIDSLDRAALFAAGFNPAKGFVPQFAAMRPGQLRFLPTEQEAALLADCLTAVNWACRHGQTMLASNPWGKDRNPVARPGGKDGFVITLERKDAPSRLAPSPKLTAEERKRIDGVPRKRTGVELDCFFFGAIGPAMGRKAAGLLALLVDDGGFVVANEPGAIGQEGLESVADLLRNAVLEGIRTIGGVPSRITMRTPELAEQIGALAQALGIEVRVSPNMPGLDPARDAFLQASRQRVQ